VLLDHFHAPRITCVETVLINDHGQTLQPLIPALFRYTGKFADPIRRGAVEPRDPQPRDLEQHN